LKALIQRVTSASVAIDGITISKIASGFLILLGVERGDGYGDIKYLVKKTIGLRIFKDGTNNMNLSIQDVGGEALVVSQFTLCADTSKGRRPSFLNATSPKVADQMYQQYCEQLTAGGVPIQTGRFGAMMEVSLVNDGPVTIMLNSHNKN